MGVWLAIETSTASYGVALGTEGRVIYETSGNSPFVSERNILGLVKEALHETGLNADQISTISTNVGPGSLGAIRDGLAFAGGLSVGLQVPVVCYNSFELLVHQVQPRHERQVACVIANNSGIHYGAIGKSPDQLITKLGSIDTIVALIRASETPTVMAGRWPDGLKALGLDDLDIIDSNVGVPIAKSQIEIEIVNRKGIDPTREPLVALNEEAAIFNE